MCLRIADTSFSLMVRKEALMKLIIKESHIRQTAVRNQALQGQWLL